MSVIRDAGSLLEQVRAIHEQMRAAIVAACESSATEDLAAVVAEEGGDTIYAIDRVSETVLVDAFTTLARARMRPLVLVAEGLGTDGRRVLPEGAREADAEIVVLVDPIDGTRGLAYQKRPAWILTGVAPARTASGAPPTLQDIALAVQTEIPLVKQHLCDTFWALAGQGAAGERTNRLTGERRPLVPAPSRARTIAQGYGGLARFFPGARAVLAAVDDDVARTVLGPTRAGHAAAFEDQYISTGGQLYELMMGHDRWLADLRPQAEAVLRARGEALGLCCHAYDLATELIAREAGVVVTDAAGGPLRAPLDVTTAVSWIGYANTAIQAQVEPALRAAMQRANLTMQTMETLE